MRLLVPLGIILALASAQKPLVPARNYDQTVVLVTGDEAIALAAATSAMESFLEKNRKGTSIRSYFATIERRAPSFWLVRWSLNQKGVRGGSVVVTLDALGKKLVEIKEEE